MIFYKVNQFFLQKNYTRVCLEIKKLFDVFLTTCLVVYYEKVNCFILYYNIYIFKLKKNQHSQSIWPFLEY